MSVRGDCHGDAILLAGATGRRRALATIGAALSPEARAGAHAIEADLTNPADAERAVSATVERFGRIDALVNLAGSGFGRTAFAESSLDDLRGNIDSFVVTAYTIASAAVRAMLTQAHREGATGINGALVDLNARETTRRRRRRAAVGTRDLASHM